MPYVLQPDGPNARRPQARGEGEEMSLHETQYLRFMYAPKQNPKTAIWFVAAKDGGGMLGEVRWFGRWRKYSFFPLSGTIYEQTCLRDIATFCEEQTSAHRKRVKP